MFFKTPIGSTDTIVYVLLREILNEVNTKKEWLSIAEFFPLISEACPQIVIEKLKEEIADLSSEFWEIFNVSGKNSLLSGDMYHHVLWAIERLVWLEDYAVDAIFLLVKMAQKKLKLPNGNTPESSLTQIFNMIFPQTVLSKADLAKLLGKVIRDYPDVGLELVDEMSGRNNTHLAITMSKPEWIEYTDPYKTRSLTNKECIEFRNEIIATFFESINKKDVRVYEIILKNIDFFYYGYNLKIKELTKDNTEEFSDKEKLSLSVNIRRTIFNNKMFLNRETNLADEVIEFLEMILTFVEPSNIMKYVYLCEYNPPVSNPIPYSDPNEYDMKKEEALVYSERKKAIQEIIENYGTEKIVEYCKFIEDTSDFAKIIIEDVLEGNFDIDFLLKIKEINQNLFKNLLFFLNRDGLENMLKILRETETLSWEQEAEILSQSEHSIVLWEEIESKNPLIIDYFWKKSSLVPIDHLSEEDVEYYIRKLVEHNRVIEVINSAAYSNYNDYKMLFFLLHSLRESINDEKSRTNLNIKAIDPSKIQNIFKKIYQEKNKNVEAIAMLELYFIDILPFEFYPQAINEWVAKQPELYVQLVSSSYLDDSENNRNTDNSASFHKLLDKVTTIPGCNKDIVEKEIFESWITTVINNAKENKYIKVVLNCLGTLLSYSPDGNDGIFPHEVVREFFEENMSESNISEHLVPYFTTGKINKDGSSGGFSSSLEKGEKWRAKKYYTDSQAIKIDYPETASVLKRLSNHYEWSSKQLINMDERYFD